jgi:sulfocyanin
MMARQHRNRWIQLMGGVALATALTACGASSGGSAAPSSSASPSSSTASSSASKGATSPWMTYQTSTKTVTLKLVAGYNSNLSGFNFNGYGNGQMVISVPSGWKVTVDFSNQGQLPHSAAVVTTATSSAPAFPGAGLPSSELASGIASGQTATFSFTAGAPGTYRIACLVPGHEGLGMWDTFKVTSGGTPSVKT